MPTVVQTAFRILAIVTLSVFWSSITALKLLWAWWKNRKTGQPFFPNKPHPAPAVLNEWKHGHLQLSQVKLHYVETGEEDKPLMLCLHGFPEFWYSFRHQLRHFKDNYHVVALDLRGYNDSSKPAGIHNYHPDLLANDVMEAIEQLNQHQQQQGGGKGVVLVGHDWGGGIAWMVAMERPELVHRLIIMNCPHPKALLRVIRTRSTQLLKSHYVFSFQCPWLGELRMRALDFQFLEEVFRSDHYGLVNKDQFTDEDLECFKHVFSKRDALTPPLNYYRAAMRIAGRRHFPSELIEPKTLIIWGEQDCALEVEGAELSVRMCRDAQLELIPDASHWVQQDFPDQVNSLMEKFLSE